MRRSRRTSRRSASSRNAAPKQAEVAPEHLANARRAYLDAKVEVEEAFDVLDRALPALVELRRNYEHAHGRAVELDVCDHVREPGLLRGDSITTVMNAGGRA